MKKYTIIYSVRVGWRNMHCMSVERDRVETNDLKSLIDSPKYEGHVHFIFEGWPTLEGE
jgi:hypothetical protein